MTIKKLNSNTFSYLIGAYINKYIFLVSILLLTCFCGCQQKGPVEKTGARVDEIIDNVSEGEAPLKKKGPMEKAGEAIDETFD